MKQPHKTSRLIFPDGIRLAHFDELPGPDSARIKAWELINSADICSGFLIRSVDDPRFSVYAEANVDAPHIWDVFRSLAEAMLGDSSCPYCPENRSEPVRQPADGNS
jgi:hypothetical protein